MELVGCQFGPFLCRRWSECNCGFASSNLKRCWEDCSANENCCMLVEMRINEGNEWMKLAETIQGNERCLFSRTLLQVGEGFFVRKISGGSNQFPFWGKRMQLRKSWPSSWEPLAARKTSTSTVLSCLRPSKASQLKISTLNEMIMAERVSWRFEHLSCQFEQHQTTSQYWMVYAWWWDPLLLVLAIF